MNKFKVNKLKCAGCGVCLRACPHGAIEIGEDGKAFIDQSKCKECGECQRICPFNAIEEISDGAGERKIEQSESVPSSFPYRPSVGRREGSSTERGSGKGMDRGMGRGLGRGPRDGRGEIGRAHV